MAFDAETFRAAHRPWMFTIGRGRARRTFTAQHVSAVQVLRYQDKLAQADDDPRKVYAALWWLLRLAFPWRFSYLLRGDPARLVIQLEPAARAAALTDFFAALHGNPAPRQNGPETAGTNSPRPILIPRA